MEANRSSASEKDTARLDWITETGAELYCGGGVWCVSTMEGEYEGKTPREAIDKAMEAES
ncbi:MAG TPA: hypothetical protein VJ801_14325, partial [Polyangia bacterium]|nr:hypothetical protein [Polyangia bacterium]